MEDNSIIITNPNTGIETKMTVLFTTTNDETGVKYVFFYDEKKPSDILVMRYDEKGNLFEIENDEEYDYLDEVLDSFIKDEKKKAKKESVSKNS